MTSLASRGPIAMVKMPKDIIAINVTTVLWETWLHPIPSFELFVIAKALIANDPFLPKDTTVQVDNGNSNFVRYYIKYLATWRKSLVVMLVSWSTERHQTQ